MTAPANLPDFIASAPADVDLSASQYCGVSINSSGELVLPSAGAAIVGVLQNDPDAAGKAGTYQHTGVTKMKLGGTVAQGDKVKVDSSGRAVTASAADVLAGQCIGWCRIGGAVNNIGEIQLALTATGVSGGGYLDTALDTSALDAANLYSAIYFSIADTKSAALPAGVTPGQIIELHCDAVSGTPAGTVSGTFLSQAGGSGTGLAYNAAGDYARLVWTGAAWRVLALNSVILS